MNDLTFEIGNTSVVSSSEERFEELLVSTGAVYARRDGTHNAVDLAVLGLHQSAYASG